LTLKKIPSPFFTYVIVRMLIEGEQFMAINVDSSTEKKIEELAKTLGRSKSSVLKEAVRHYAKECTDLDEAMRRLHDPHARLIDHEEAKRALKLVD